MDCIVHGVTKESDAAEQLSQREKFMFITYEHRFVDFLLCARYWLGVRTKRLVMRQIISNYKTR